MKVRSICKLHPFQLGNEISFDSDTDIISPQHRSVCGNLCFTTCDSLLTGLSFLFLFLIVLGALFLLKHN